MKPKVNLKELMDAMDSFSDEHCAWVNLDTGEVLEPMFDEDSEPVDEPGGPPGRTAAVPSKFDIHEWSIMEQFARTVEKPEVRDDLQFALHGSGAFRHFKRALERHGLREAWFAHRDAAFREIATDWCKEHGLEWE